MYKINFRKWHLFLFSSDLQWFYYCIYNKPSMTECSGFYPWFHKRAISFSFKFMNLIAVCQFCKLDRCVQLKGVIKGKAGGP